MNVFEKFIAISQSSAFLMFIKILFVYLAALWFAMIIWVGKDIIERSNSFLFQTAAILVNIFLPVFGLFLYLIIRPGKTLMEKYYDELEYNFFAENLDANSTCESCQSALLCPECGNKSART